MLLYILQRSKKFEKLGLRGAICTYINRWFLYILHLFLPITHLEQYLYGELKRTQQIFLWLIERWEGNFIYLFLFMGIFPPNVDSITVRKYPLPPPLLICIIYITTNTCTHTYTLLMMNTSFMLTYEASLKDLATFL